MTEIEIKLQELIEQGYENEVIEFKEAKNQYDFDKIVKYFSALSNEANLNNQNSAWLVFGIRDKDKAIVNTQFRKEVAHLNSLKGEIARHTTNNITFKEIHVIETNKGRVILFEIPAAPQGIPIAWKGYWHGRNGEELQSLNIEKIERIRNQSSFLDWSAEIIEEATLEDLSQEAILFARKEFKVKNPKLKEDIDNWSDEVFLNKARLTIKSKITRTAIILLGNLESEHFLSPSTSKITWILKDRDNLERDYEHFYCPLLINITKIYDKIRNLKYRYISDASIFPEEVDQYDPYIIREALNNCIAHQDYTLGGRIIVVENEDGYLIFNNEGDFIPKSVEQVVINDTPETKYRNPFLANAMVNLNMIDTIGSGIKKMFIIQKNKYFPLPDYDTTNQKVKLTITGKIIDMNYAYKLATINLTLIEIIALDKLVKQKDLNDIEIKLLKDKNLIEGRKPNFYIAASVAKAIGEEGNYIKNRGIDDEYCQKIILDYLKEFKEGEKIGFEKVLLSKLPDALDKDQKRNRIKNNLQRLRKDKKIEFKNRKWYLV